MQDPIISRVQHVLEKMQRNITAQNPTWLVTRAYMDVATNSIFLSTPNDYWTVFPYSETLEITVTLNALVALRVLSSKEAEHFLAHLQSSRPIGNTEVAVEDQQKLYPTECM